MNELTCKAIAALSAWVPSIHNGIAVAEQGAQGHRPAMHQHAHQRHPHGPHRCCQLQLVSRKLNGCAIVTLALARNIIITVMLKPKNCNNNLRLLCQGQRVGEP